MSISFKVSLPKHKIMMGGVFRLYFTNGFFGSYVLIFILKG